MLKLNMQNIHKKNIYTFSYLAFSSEQHPNQTQKAIMKKLYNRKIDDSFLANPIKSFLKATPAFIAYKGEIKMDYFAQNLDDYNIQITVVNLDINPVLNEAFSNFYPYINKSKYLLFFKGKLADIDEFQENINKGSVEEYFKSNNLI